MRQRSGGVIKLHRCGTLGNFELICFDTKQRCDSGLGAARGAAKKVAHLLRLQASKISKALDRSVADAYRRLYFFPVHDQR